MVIPRQNSSHSSQYYGGNPGGVVHKFLSRSGSRNTDGKSSASGIPRFSASQGIRKKVGNVGITKSRTRQSIAVGSQPRKASQTKYSISAITSRKENIPKKTSLYVNNISRIPGQKKSDGPIFKEVVDMPKKKSGCMGVRKALGNLNNSSTDLVVQEAAKSNATKDESKTLNGFEFVPDPDALESILNNEGITRSLMQKKNEALQNQSNTAKSDALLLPDGRPSLCRRVQIRSSSANEGRPSINGPSRILSGKKGIQRISYAGQRNSYLRPLTASNRHSLYSVIQGRYSQHNNDKSLLGRHSYQPDAVKKLNRKVAGSVPVKQFKSPSQPKETQKMLSQENEVRISASPALRIPIPRTPTPRRVLKKGNRRGVNVKWADENSPCVRGKLAVHLFQDSPPMLKTPLMEQIVLAKTPVSILKSRKHGKRNSLTPPVLKKEKADLRDKDNDINIEIVSPQVINENQIQSIEEYNVAEKRKDSTSDKAKERFFRDENLRLKPGSKTEMNCVLEDKLSKDHKPDALKTLSQPAVLRKQKVVEVDEVLQILQHHMTSVKRRSVQNEFSNVMQHIATTLKGPSSKFEAIQEERDVSGSSPSTNRPTEDENQNSVKSSPCEVTIPLPADVTPESITDIRKNGDEATNRTLDEIALETERINQELTQLKLEKEKLNKFQEQVRKCQPRSLSQLKNQNEPKKLHLSKPLKSDKEPVTRTKSPVTKSPNQNNSLNSSWEKILKSEMQLSPSDSLRHDETVDSTLKLVQLTPPHSAPPPPVSNAVLQVQNREPPLTKVPFPTNSSISEKFPAVNKKVTLADRLSRIQKNILASNIPGSSWVKDVSSTVHSSNCAKSVSHIERTDGRDKQSNYLAHPYHHGNINSTVQLISEKTVGASPPLKGISKALLSSSNDGFGNDLVAFSKLGKTDFQTLPISSMLSNVEDVGASPFSDSSVTNESERVSWKTKSSGQEKPDSTETIKAFENDELRTVNQAFVFSETNGERGDAPTEVAFAPRFVKNQDQSTGSPSKIPVIAAPAPVYPLPPQTPVAFRALRIKSENAQVSPFKVNPRAHIKEKFTQALLDEEVSLLTCRVVRPSTLYPKPACDPVAKSLSDGDATHFVPIPKTPSTPKHTRRSSFKGSAFSKFLRS